MIKEFFKAVLVDHHQRVRITCVEDFKNTEVSYEQRIANENWTFDTKPRDEVTGNEVAIDNRFVYKYLLLERRLSAYKGLDYWDFIRNIVNCRRYTRILSIGSGPCAVEMEIAEKFVRPYVIDCLDLNENLIKAATERARARGINLNPVVADLNTIRFEDKYDLVIVCAALHHFVELEAVFERIHDALNDSGLFVTYEPVMRSGMFLYPATRLFLGLLFFALPKRLRVNHQDYPGEKRVDRFYYEYDRSGWTFECVRSGDIPKLLPNFFRTVHFGRGMTFLRRVADSIYGANYRLETRADRLVTEVLCWIDRFFRATHLLQPEGLFFIGSRRDCARPIIPILGDPARSNLGTGLSAAKCDGFVFVPEPKPKPKGRQRGPGVALASTHVLDSFTLGFTVGSLGNVWLTMYLASGGIAGTLLTQIDGVDHNVTDCNDQDAVHYASGGDQVRVLVATGLSEGAHTIKVTNWPSASSSTAAFVWIGEIESP